MTVLHLDIETRSTVELRETGAHVYMEDETTDIWCVAYAFDDGPIDIWTPGEPCPPEIRQHVESGGEIAAWNAQFERLAWRHILGPRYGWPVPKLEQYRCVMVEALAMSLPGALENAAPAVGIKEEKDQVGKRIMLQMSRPRQIFAADEAKKMLVGGSTQQGWWTRLSDGRLIRWWADSEKLTRLYEYCKQDVEVERQIEKRLVRLSSAERRVWLLDQTINDRGIHVDIPLCRAALKVVEEATKKLDAEMADITDRDVTACSQVSRLIVWLAKNGVDTKSVAKAELTDLLGRDDLQPRARRALELRQEAAKASTAKIETLLTGVSRDGTVKGLLQYHGAGRTGRWAGRRFQPQNLPRSSIKVSESDIDLLRSANTALIEMIYGSPLTFVSDCIRSLLVAPPGHELLAADFSNIEGRVLAWIAGQQDKVRIFAANGPIYERMAAKIYGIPVEQIEDPSPERQLGKVAELGCGFGMGPPKFRETCRKQGIVLDQGMAERTVAAFREVNNRIVALWYDTEEPAIGAVERKGAITESGRVKFRVNGSFLWCKLPSGRNLVYPYPKLIEKMTPWGEMKTALAFKGVDTYTRQWGETDTYGAKLVENIVQATARDLMADAMLRLEAAGYPIILTVHDEVIAQVPKGGAAKEEFERIMSIVPAWAAGCPVAAKGWVGQRYRK